MSAAWLAAAVLVTVAAGLWFGAPAPRRLLEAPPPARAAQSRRAGALVVGAVALATAALLASGVFAHWLAFVVAGGEVAATAAWLVTRSITQGRAMHNERQVVKACTMIAGLLDTGEVPHQALAMLAEELPLLGPAAGAVQVGGDVPSQLRALARGPGCAGLGALAGGWQLCENLGMPLGPITRQVADDLTRQGDVREQRRAELATSRSTSRLLAALPVVGLGMGFLVDANPLNFLTGGLAGHLCLVGAATLACAGLIWTEHLAREDR